VAYIHHEVIISECGIPLRKRRTIEGHVRYKGADIAEMARDREMVLMGNQ